jgi:DNA replication protein DnaC
VTKDEACAKAVEKLLPRLTPKLRKAVNEHPTASALFLGPTGCGKSSAAMVMRFLLKEPEEWVWMKATALGASEKRHSLGDGEPPEVAQSKRARFLVIDDVGNERDTAPLAEVLDHRYEKALPTIVTTGLPREGLVAHIGAAFVRRITEQFAGHKVLVVDCHV